MFAFIWIHRSESGQQWDAPQEQWCICPQAASCEHLLYHWHWGWGCHHICCHLPLLHNKWPALADAPFIPVATSQSLHDGSGRWLPIGLSSSHPGPDWSVVWASKTWTIRCRVSLWMKVYSNLTECQSVGWHRCPAPVSGPQTHHRHHQWLLWNHSDWKWIENGSVDVWTSTMNDIHHWNQWILIKRRFKWHTKDIIKF